MKKKFAVDFDDTLTEEEVQEFVVDLMNRGYEPWVVTARYPDDYDGVLFKGQEIDNSGLFEVTNRLGIEREHIVFMSFELKVNYFEKNPDFLFLLDDNFFRESNQLNVSENCEVVGVCYNPLMDWRGKIEEILKKDLES